ncbi:MAG: hypothetical protein ACYC3L_00710 [Gemmatimonadaceae bacterium]
MTWFTEADVEAAAERIERLTGYDMTHCHEVARAALTAIPDPRAAGFEAAIQEAIAYHRDAAAGLRFDHAAAAGVGVWVADSGGTLLHYADLHDGHAAAIAALKPEDKP